MTVGQYCRRVESYMCQKNDGHLIRIVGPTFDLVRGWADGGIPISVVERAIDRTYTRYYAIGTKRKPVRVEYCEQEVVVLFDEWKRAVGIGKFHPYSWMSQRLRMTPLQPFRQWPESARFPHI